MSPFARGAMTGILGALAVGSIGIGATALVWPETGILGTFGRIFDSLSLHMLGFGACLGLCLAGLGARRSGVALGGAALLAAGLLLWPLRTAPAPAEEAVSAGSGLQVLWFNIYQDNATPPETLAEALIGSGADLVVLAEASPLRPVLEKLAGTYPHQLGCRGRVCATLVLSRHPFVPDRTEMIDGARKGRLAAFAIQPAKGAPLSVVAAHLTKPWYHGFFDVDLWYLLDRSAAAEGPLLVMGDFNATPWSRPMQRIRAETGAHAPGWPVATWPAGAGGLGLPIDHLLVRDGAVLGPVTPWGAGLGSNHRGLLARIRWPGGA